MAINIANLAFTENVTQNKCQASIRIILQIMLGSLYNTRLIIPNIMINKACIAHSRQMILFMHILVYLQLFASVTTPRYTYVSTPLSPSVSSPNSSTVTCDHHIHI